MSLIGDLFGGGGSQSGSAQTTVSQRSSPEIEDALGRLVPQIESLGQTPVQQPGFDTVVPFSTQTEQALQGIEGRAIGGSDLERGAQDQILRTLMGEFTQDRNPHFDEFAQQLTGDIGSQIQSQFMGSGRLGSQANAEALGRGISAPLSGLAFQDYQQERENQLNAATAAPGLAQIDFNNLSQLLNVGGAREQQEGASLQDQISRFNFGQQEPRSRLAETLSLLAGGQFGQDSTTTQPTFSNPTGSGIANLAGLAQVGGSLFGGKNAIFPNFFK